MDIETGDILATTSTPSFDPNLISKKLDAEEWKLIVDQKNLFINKCFLMTYSPGSIFKIVSALDALDYGIKEKNKFFCSGKYKVGNRFFHCHKKQGHGYIDLESAITKSCNCYFYDLGTKVNIDHLLQTSEMLGFDQTYDVSYLSNVRGVVPSTEWKRRLFKEKWFTGETVNTVIGQGYLAVTPLQMTIMTARVASGKSIIPYIINDGIRSEQHDLDISKAHLDVVRNGMEGVFKDRTGTCGFLYRKNPKYQIAGKTGTSQIISRRIDAKEINAGKISKEIIAHGMFVGYGPVSKPRFAVSVVLENGRAGANCAPIGDKMIRAAIDKML